MSYLIGIDREISVGDKVYYVGLDADIDYSCSEDPEPTGVEITNVDVAPLDGDSLPISYEGRTIEKLIVEGHPELTEAIDQALWEEIDRYGSDNAYEISRDLRDAYDERDL